MAAPGMRPHDWEIEDLGFMLVDPALLGGATAHTIEPIPFLAQQISSQAEPTYSDINREVEVAFAQDDFSGGLADDLRFGFRSQQKVRWAKNADTSFGLLLPGPKVTTIGATITNKPTLAVQRGNITYVAAGADLYQVTNNITRTLDVTFAASITALLVWGGYLVVGLGSSTNFRYRASDTLTGAFSDGGAAAHFLAAESYRLYRANQPNDLYVADGITGPWTSSFKVGDSSFNITGLAVVDGVLVIGKEDGPYTFASDLEAEPLAPELRIQADAQVCKVMATFNRDLYFSTRLGIAQLVPGTGMTQCGLDLLADPALPGTPPVSKPTAFTTDGRFLYALVVSGNGVYIWKRDLSGNWHNYLYRTDLGASSDLLFATSKVGSTSTNAIMFAYASGGNWQLAYGLFPATANPLKDTNYQFDTTTGSMRTLDYVAVYPTVQKFVERVKVVGDNLDSTKYVTTSVWLDNEATAVSVGEFRVSPHKELPLPTPKEFHRISLQFDLTTTATSAPQVRAFHASATYLTRVVRRHTCQFIATSAIRMATGGTQRGHYDQVVERLRELRREQVIVNCRDEDGRKFRAKLDDIAEVVRQEKQGQGFVPVKVITAILKEVVEE